MFNDAAAVAAAVADDDNGTSIIPSALEGIADNVVVAFVAVARLVAHK